MGIPCIVHGLHTTRINVHDTRSPCAGAGARAWEAARARRRAMRDARSAGVGSWVAAREVCGARGEGVGPRVSATGPKGEAERRGMRGLRSERERSERSGAEGERGKGGTVGEGGANARNVRGSRGAGDVGIRARGGCRGARGAGDVGIRVRERERSGGDRGHVGNGGTGEWGLIPHVKVRYA